MAKASFLVGIVDDEPPARAKLRRYLDQYPNFEICGEAATGAEAVRMLAGKTPSLLFLDIELPDMSGFDLIRRFPLPPDSIIVFATAHEQHALAAFEVQALGYLVKPISPVGFGQLMARVESKLNDHQDAAVLRDLRQRPARFPERLMCRSGKRSLYFLVRDIVFIEAARNYAVVHVGSETHILRRTLDSLESALDPDLFVRISRSVIVNREFVKAVEVVSHGDHQVELQTGHLLTWTRKYHGAPELIRKG